MLEKLLISFAVIKVFCTAITMRIHYKETTYQYNYATKQ